MRKGLCQGCVDDKDCALPRKYPIWFCEEFKSQKPQDKEKKKKTGR